MSNNAPKDPNQARLLSRINNLQQSMQAASACLHPYALGRDGADRETIALSISAARAHLVVAMRRLAAVDEALGLWDPEGES